MIDVFAAWLRSTRLAWAVAGGYPWIWPACEMLHLLGMALLLGVVAIVNLRLLGVAAALPVQAVDRLRPWGVLGFAVTAATGVLFVIGGADQYMGNVAFWLKMLFIALAGLNVWLFRATGLARRLRAVDAASVVPPAAKISAALALVLWIGVVYWGRMLPFIGNAF